MNNSETNSKILYFCAEAMTNRDVKEIPFDSEFLGNQLMAAALTDDYSLINVKMGSYKKN